ncbi:hypothetical protein Q3G72_016126 [Acer saccharum]|nr:hypothetical protein Q3G72_016126 [Acer saccharum]
MMYGQNAIAMNEFLDKRWDMPNTDLNIEARTIGEMLLKAEASSLKIICFGFALEHYLGIDMAVRNSNGIVVAVERAPKKGMRNQELIKELSALAPGSKDLYFLTKYSQSFLTQCNACFWKQQKSYWRHSNYNDVRFVMTTSIAILFGLIFWNMGQKTNAMAMQPVVSVERTVFYRERAAGMYSALPYAFAQQIPVWLRWYYWGSPVAWTLYGILASQVGDINTTLQMSGSANTNTTVRGYLKDSFGMERDFLPYVAIAHVGWVLLFLFLFAYGIKFLNFQRS